MAKWGRWGKLLGVCGVVLFFGHVSRNVYRMTSPPVDPQGSKNVLQGNSVVSVSLTYYNGTVESEQVATLNGRYILGGVPEVIEYFIPPERCGNNSLHVLLDRNNGNFQKVFPMSFLVKPTMPEYYLLNPSDTYTPPEEWPSWGYPTEAEVTVVVEDNPLSPYALYARFGPNVLLRGPNELYYNLPSTFTPKSPRDEFVRMTPENCKSKSIKISFNTISYRAWAIRHSAEQSLDRISGWGVTEYDIDSLRMMYHGSSVFLLCSAYAISFLHLIFEFLAVCNDIQFWMGAKSFEGISAEAILYDTGFEIIIFLYLWDVSESILVLWFIIARIITNIWKIFKLATVKAQYDEVDLYERRCINLITKLCIPIMGAICLYRLIYHPHRGWYSWLIRSLAICAYGGGFIAMTPQLFRNHKLRSVDHLPWDVLTYQAINTFIDDIFAFLVRMPDMHRMSVFRDDIIFVVYHIQRYLYRNPKKETPPSIEDKPQEEVPAVGPKEGKEGKPRRRMNK